MRIKERKPAQPAKEKPEIPPEPDWIKRIQAQMPSYADELLAVFLIMLGLLSFFTLLSPTSGDIGDIWARALQKAFGWGAYVVSTVIITAGALILAPKINIKVRLNWWRIIAGEWFFVFLLAYTHAFIRWSIGGEDGQIEAFARAFEGRGGGVIGWAIQDVFHSLLGDFVTGVVLLSLLAISGGVMAGFRRRHMVGILGWLNIRLMKIAARINPVIKPQIQSAAGQGGAQPASDVDGEDSPDMGNVMKGRPSIVTGMRADAPEIPATGPLTNGQAEEEEEAKEVKPKREIRYRFTVAELRDKKKFRKRPDELPSLDLLDVTDFERPTEHEINLAATIIEETVEDFGMKVEVVGVKAGPTVTQYAVQPFASVEKDGKKVVQRVRVTKVAGLAKDISLALQAPRVRIQAPVPGTNYVGVEVPNARPGVVSLRPIIESEQFYKYNSPLTLGLGREVDGRPFAVDLATMPHMLIGGTTGSGKSVCITSIATCLITNNTPEDLRLILIDPKMVELVRFNGLPHLLGHVEVQLDRIIGVLRWLTREMDYRYKLMEEDQARNITVYNKGKRKGKRLPYIVVLIDELAELMNEFPDETEHLITRLAQMARATGIHLVVATQRPSTDVLTGLIKANFPARISFAVASGIDSRVIIDAVGAEDLIGKGDLLFQGSDAAGPVRLQGCFVNDNELDRIVEFWRATWKDAEEETEAPWERALARAAVLEETDSMIEKAIRLVQQEGHASASLLQRKLGIGYPRAGRLVDTLYAMEVIGEEETGGRNRKLRIGRDVDPTAFIIDWRAGR